jgi:hypothetical protein
MPEFSELVGLLREAVAEPARLAMLVPKVQDLVWHSAISFPSQAAEAATRDLANDLDYYVSDPKHRAEDSSYFGEDRAVEEIRSALGLMDKSQ